MMRVRYPAEFKAEAVKQVTERGHGVVDEAKRLGMSDQSLYLWVRLAQGQQGVGNGENASLKAEVSRLKAELKRANEERDILKKAALDSTGECKDNQLVPSMSRRGNCWDNAVAESFFSSLKKERIKRQIYASRQEAKSDVFDYIEGFYNRVRRHSHLDQLSPQPFEQLQTKS